MKNSQIVLTKYKTVSEDVKKDLEEYLELLNKTCEKHKDTTYKIKVRKNSIIVNILKLNAHVN